MWKDLSIKEKSQVMQMAVQQGVTDLNEIRKLYDSSIDVTNVTPNNTYDNVPYYPSPEEVRYAYGGNIYKGGGKQRRRVDPDANNKAMFNKALPFYEEMISWGIDPMTAIGILGNMAQESSFVPTASNRKHFGYIQNQTSIRDFIIQQYGGYGHKEQMQYIRDGLKGKLRGQNTPTGFQLQQRFNDYINNIGKVKTPAEAAALWENSYEKSGEQNMKERQGYASYFYDRLRPYSVPRKAAASKPQIPVDTSIEKWSIEDALRNGGVTKFKVTSAHRTPEQQKKFKTKNSKHLIYLSNGTPAAMDIVPTDGDYDRLIREVANGSPEMHSYFAANNIGILDERSKEMRAKTGGTGKHLHIGLYDNPNGTMANTYRNWVTQYRTTPLDLHHPIQDVKWTPPTPIYDAGFDSGIGTESNPVDLAEVAIVGNKKFTNPTQVERHEAEIDSALDYASAMNNGPLIPERSPSYIPELIMPNYTSVIKPLFAVNIDTPYTDYILGRRDNVAALGGKLFDEGGEEENIENNNNILTSDLLRKYGFKYVPISDVYNNLTEEELNYNMAGENMSVKEYYSNFPNALIAINTNTNRLVTGSDIKNLEKTALLSDLTDWSPESWFDNRVEKPDGTKYNQDDVKSLKSHLQEYKDIEVASKANGTWLKMPNGTKWDGDPRSWIMMQSDAYKKNYLIQPWYTGQARWDTQFDYGNGLIDTDKLTRAPYYDKDMWFSNDRLYGDTFANIWDSKGEGIRFDKREEKDVTGKTFLAGIPRVGNYRFLQSPSEKASDFWRQMPFVLQNGTISRLPESEIYKNTKVEGDIQNMRKDGKEVLTDDVVKWSESLGDDGIFMFRVDDGPVIFPSENGKLLINGPTDVKYETIPTIINEFISQPGFTRKIKFIEGNNGDFDINNPYKYSYIDDAFEKILPDFNYAKVGGRIRRRKKSKINLHN